MSNKVQALTAFVNSVTALVKSKHGDEGAVVNATRSMTNLSAEDAELDDPDLQEACNELATAAMSQVSTGGKKSK